MEELDAWLALLHLPRLGAGAAAELIGRYGGSAAAVFQEGSADPALAPALRAALGTPDAAAIAADRTWLEGGPGRHILPRTDPRYPERLRAIPDAPLLLFVFGEPAVLDAPQLAMVGSRNPSAAGAETAFEFARHLARAGITVTSGLALGIDGACHEGALAGPGSTVAVAGTGPDRVYPARHRDLAHRIVDGGGALVSEFAPGTPPRPGHFPRRNRIISALALGTLVVEAALRSGSLITARLAAEQGREVFAIPGSIHNPLARGCHRLIREGAKLVETAADILEELAPQLHEFVIEEQQDAAEAPPHEGLTAEQRTLLEAVGFDPTPIDQVVERSGLTAEVVSSMLLLLELDGYVNAAPGGRYSRTAKR